MPGRVMGASVKPTVSTFAPTDVANLGAWWDASDAASITASAGAVSQWNDKSGNARHLTSAGSNKPITGASTTNSLNVLDFTSDVLQNTAGPALDNTTTTLLVVKVTDFSVLRVVASGTGDTLELLTATNSSGVPYCWCGPTGTPGGPALTAATWAQVSTKLNGASTIVYTNGSAGSTGSVGSNTATGLIVGGASNLDPPAAPFIGSIAEMCVYTTALSDVDRVLVQNYLKAKWATP